MRSPQAIHVDPNMANLLRSFWQWRGLWLLTTAAFCFLGVAYALFLKKDTWIASQALIVRDEATGAVVRLGRFESQTQMKASQETVLEMARNPLVVEAALNAIGYQPKFYGLRQGDSQPTRAEIEQFAKSSVVVRAPRGSELGTTQLIYLDVKDSSKERAVLLAEALCDALEKQLKAMRVELAMGVIQELEAARLVCQASLQEATNELQKMEIEVGSDLADLRGLSDTTVGSTNRLMLDLVRDELRKTDLSVRTMEPNFKLAQTALEDPDLVLQAADALKDTHPAIDRLREGLAEARVKTANLEGRFTASHPDVINARKIEAAFQKSLLEELSAVVRGYQSKIAMARQKIEALNSQEVELGKRLNRLADIRGRYTNLVAEVKTRAESLSQIKKELTQTIASRDAAEAASLLTRLDGPILGEKPVGPGRTTIIGGATVGGLMFGLGIVFLLIPLDGRPVDAEADCNRTLDRSSHLANEKVDSAPCSHVQVSMKPGYRQTMATSKPPMTPSTYSPTAGAKVDSRQATTSLQAQPLAGTTQVSPSMTPHGIAATNSATALAVGPTEPLIPCRPESIDEVRDLITNALKGHTLSGTR